MDGPWILQMESSRLSPLPSAAGDTHEPDHRADAEEHQRRRFGDCVSVTASDSEEPLWLMLTRRTAGVGISGGSGSPRPTCKRPA